MRYYDYMLKRLEEEKQKEKEEQANMQSDNLDMVNSPAHYNKAGIETIDIIQSVTGDGFEAYLQGNILKYMCRYKYKNGLEDLEKAQWYLNRLIETKIGDEYDGV
jgi:hypothetical protein